MTFKPAAVQRRAKEDLSMKDNEDNKMNIIVKDCSINL